MRVWIVEVQVFYQHCFSSVVASQIQGVVRLVSEHGVAPVVERLKDTFVVNGASSIILEANSGLKLNYSPYIQLGSTFLLIRTKLPKFVRPRITKNLVYQIFILVSVCALKINYLLVNCKEGGLFI